MCYAGLLLLPLVPVKENCWQFSETGSLPTITLPAFQDFFITWQNLPTKSPVQLEKTDKQTSQQASLKPLAPPLEFRSHPILPVPLWLPFLRAARHWGLLAFNKILHIACRAEARTPIQGDKTWPWANIESYCLEHTFFQPYGSEELLPTEKPKHNLISSLQYQDLQRCKIHRGNWTICVCTCSSLYMERVSDKRCVQ